MSGSLTRNGNEVSASPTLGTVCATSLTGRFAISIALILQNLLSNSCTTCRLASSRCDTTSCLTFGSASAYLAASFSSSSNSSFVRRSVNSWYTSFSIPSRTSNWHSCSSAL
uniref:(northern house mosquito) hypothetical protein n=1 Tax=Culex pipiens TaxID=7175 RepID=A0A8D8GY74_CULPI